MTAITAWCKAHHLTEVEALTPDMSGIARGNVMPAAKYCAEEGMRSPKAVFLQTVTGDFARGQRAVHPADVDIMAHGDARTIRPVPWSYRREHFQLER